MSKRQNVKQNGNNLKTFCSMAGKDEKDSFSMIWHSMLVSNAYLGLTHRQARLFLYCIDQFYGARKPKKDHPELYDEFCFYMNWAQAKKYKFYGDSGEGNLSRDLKSLREAGFIDCITNGKANHTKSVYRFSTRWKEN